LKNKLELEEDDGTDPFCEPVVPVDAEDWETKAPLMGGSS
jgi:hypothetical protein